jgi:putative ABC transport system ATP-binding protein
MIQQWLRRFGNNGHAAPEHGEHTHLLELHDVVKEYPTPAGTIRALKGISMHVNQGEFVAIVGKSGSGKSTLMNMLTGVDHPTSGEVWIGGVAVHTMNEDQLTRWRGRTIGVVYQSFYLLPTLTVAENVMLPMDVGNTYPAHTFRPRALELLEQVEMAEHADKLPAATSGGQQQRIAIARALANTPKLLVADEPTGSLDSQTADVVFRIFERLAQEGTTILMVTHDRELAQRAHRTITLVDGELHQTDSDIAHAEGGESIADEQTLAAS